MEYFLGSMLTLLCMFVLNKTIQKRLNYPIQIPRISQSRKHLLMLHYFNYFVKDKNKDEPKPIKKSKHGLVVDNSVYWIEDGFLYTANLIQGKLDEYSKKIVDTHNMNKVELDKIIFIVDKLNEGRNNDSGNSGNEEF
jgi:hypothetical protein